MRINNISGDRSIRAIGYVLLGSLLLVAVIVASYFLSKTGNASFADFCNWYWKSFQWSQYDSFEDVVAMWIALGILPFIAIGGIVLTICAKIRADKNFQKSLNLVSIDFLPNKVCFNFNKPQCNFECGYNDINSLEMVLKTSIVYIGRLHTITYPVISEITLNISVLNNKNFSLTNLPLSPMKKVYKIIDYGKAVQKFTHKYTGAGEIEEFEEKIRDYINTGCKQILAKRTEDDFKTHSVSLFAIGLAFLFMSKFIFGDDSIYKIMLFPALIFFIISFIFDIVLLVNKWNENRYRRF